MDGPLKAAINEVILRNRIGRQVMAACVVECAKEKLKTFGFEPAIVHVQSFSEGRVMICVAHAAAAHAVRGKGKVLIEEIKKTVPDADVKGVRVKIGFPQM